MNPLSTPERRTRLAEGAGLIVLLLALLDFFRPELLFLPTIMAGGDTPCHFPTLAWLYERLLPEGRLHGWYPGAYLGHPLLLYYFPLPFLVMTSLAPLTGLPVAFKLGTVIGVALLPLCAWAGFRLMGFGGPGALLGAATAFVFLFCEENPIWGGTIASTLTGEIAYTYGTALALLFLGAAWRAHATGRSPAVPAALLAITALAHGYAVLWAGLSAAFLLYGSRRPLRTLGWLVAVGGLAFAGAAFFLVPLLADWGWTTPYNDAWITVERNHLLPPLLWPLFAVALAGVLAPLALRKWLPATDPRVLYLMHAALVATALAFAGRALGIIDIRFVPFAQLAVCLAAGAVLAGLVRPAVSPGAMALGLTLLAVVYAEGSSRVARPWIDWNFTGLEAKELWPRWRAATAAVAGPEHEPRVAVEYGQDHEKAGSIRHYEMLPFFSGRGTLEGVYNQASLQTHYVYYLASELGASSPNPFRSREYGQFDTEAALRRLEVLNSRDVVALSSRLGSALEGRPGVEEVPAALPYRVFRLPGPRGPASYVEALAFAPAVSPFESWRDASYRWFSRHPLPRPHLVYAEDPAFTLRQDDPWLAPREVPLPPLQVSDVIFEAERIRFRVDRPGQPVLVKVSWHPRWKATGARGPYIASPALMIVVPTSNEVVLEYAARSGADVVGFALTVGALLVGGLLVWRFRPGPVLPAAEGRRWGGVIPATLLLALAALRLVPMDPPADPVLSATLHDQAEQAWVAERWSDAADYARAAQAGADPTRLDSLRVLHAESLLRAGHAREAWNAFASVADGAETPYRAQAIFGRLQAARAAGMRREADAARDVLLANFGDTPWAARARER